MDSKVTNISINQFQEYNSKDTSLLQSIELQRSFGQPEDYIELFTYDLNEKLLKSNYNYLDYKNYVANNSNGLINNLSIDPTQDAINEGYNVGSVILDYNIYRNLFESSPTNRFYIKDISTDRTELRISNNNISSQSLQTSFNDFQTLISSSNFYQDFYLNFGNDNIIIGVNLLLEQDPDQFNLLVKLYEPLPNNLTEKDQFWLVDKLSEATTYQVDFILDDQTQQNQNILRGPNFNIKLNDNINPSIDYINYDKFFSTTSTSSYQQLKSLLDEKSLDINVDYTDYSNFIHFSSAKERLLNFTYKLKLIEGYTRDLNTLITTISTPQVSSSKAIITNNINQIIEKFDGYEYYLYYTSGSKGWPKKSSTLPYINYEITSSTALTWLGDDNSADSLYGGQLYSASFYDDNNQDNLLFTIPEYIRIDDQNKGYELFIAMIGQHFDNIWLYSKGITDLYDAENNLYKGISKDLVSYALKSLGVKLYSNTSTTNDVFSYLIGITPSGSYNYSTGSEVITSFISASNTTLLGSEIDKEVYKRIYHNLPYLLKTKGTERGLRALIACYGIPDTILHINEFGGSDKTSTNYEQYFDRESYALNTKTGSIYLTTPWAPSYLQSLSASIGNIVPDTIEFRFKTNGIPNVSFYSQSLFQVGTGSATQFGVQLLFTSSSNSGSYSDYGSIRLVMSGTQGYIYSSPINLPFFDNEWWNVMVYRETGSLILSNTGSDNKYWIYVADSIYNGPDGETIGYIGSSSIFITGSTSSSYNRAWSSFDTSSFSAYLGGANSSNKINSGSIVFSGFYQELRYWTTPLPVDNFKAHTLSPLSIECNDVTGSYNNLMFRLPLGNDMAISGGANVPTIHPSITGSYTPGTGSFIVNNTPTSYGIIISPGVSLFGVAVYGSDVYYGLNTDIVYTSDTHFTYLKSGNMGLSKPTNDKIRIDTQEIISGSVLSPFIKTDQSHEIQLTKDINTLEVAFSPQDQINNDIIYQLGYFDIDTYIGDPRQSSFSQYDDLKTLREFYFKKYINNYNLFDFIRLIKYYNNSLFKMIKDFIPARTNSSTGIVIKPHILERSKVKKFEPSLLNLTYSGSYKVEKISGSSGGMFKSSSYTFNDIIKTISGSVIVIKNLQWEPFTGEFSGSKFVATNQSLQRLNPFLTGSFDSNTYYHSNYYPIFNNISQSRVSSKFFKADFNSNQNIAVNIDLIKSQSILSYASIQDSNYSLKRHINPRYLGSKTTSTLYNDYTVGDKSYGKTAAIDLTSRKLGLFVAVTSSRFIPNQQEARLKYLVDDSGSLIELNLQNKNWFEVQNTFKAGNTTTIALFDNKLFGDQRTTDGEKSIYNSGYDYSSYFYYSGSDKNTSFALTSTDNGDIFTYKNMSGSYRFVSASATDPVTSILTFYSYEAGYFYYNVSNTIYTIDINVTATNVDAYDTGCSSTTNGDTISVGNYLTISSGSNSGNKQGSFPLGCIETNYKRQNTVQVSGSAAVSAPSFPILQNGDTFTIAPCATVFTVSIDSTSCNTYIC